MPTCNKGNIDHAQTLFNTCRLQAVGGVRLAIICQHEQQINLKKHVP